MTEQSGLKLNNLAPALGSKTKAKRLGRGIGSGFGKTCGKGHKGQKARSGGYHKIGFEGGQMPIQRRLPKFGFTSRKSLVRAEVRLDELNKIDADIIDLQALKNANVIAKNIETAKIILSGEVSKAVNIKGLLVTKGAAEAIKAKGGKVD